MFKEKEMMEKFQKVLLVLCIFIPVLILCGSNGQKTHLNDGYGEYVFVAAGEFDMGDLFNEGHSDEIPVHSVYLDDYYIGKFKVTNGEFKRFIQAGGYKTSRYWTAGGFGKFGPVPAHWMSAAYFGGGLPGSENYPVVGISWYEAMAYCSWLTEVTGHTYRLPTEAEWEKAARGTEKRRYSWGDEIDKRRTNYDWGNARGTMHLTPVGFYDGSSRDGFETKSNASPYGAYDMCGLTSEWCLDWYDADYYEYSPMSNPQGPPEGSSRVLRSAGYIDSAYYQRVAGRHKKGAHTKSFTTGFRWVREPDNRKNRDNQDDIALGEYILIPAGEFKMGDNFREGDGDEVPVHMVYLDSYYIGKDKISNHQYGKFIEAGGYADPKYWEAGGFGEYGRTPRFWEDARFHGGGLTGNENFPVVGVSWYEAMAYCSWLTEVTGFIYRLPTEAEWEKAARGKDNRRFPWGASIDGSYANFEHSGDPFEPGMTPLRFYDKNVSPYGVRGMTGNVWEWCYDWYGGSDYYASSPEMNPKGPDAGSSRVLRGGGWVDSAYYHRAANRNSSFPENRNPIQGFRCVREAK
jgi:formylglycine-generating enzyme required for sulfatase activity